MKIKSLLVAITLLISTMSANAGVIELNEFSLNATTFGFDGFADGAANIKDGLLTVSDGFVRSDIPLGAPFDGPVYFAGFDNTVVRFDFASLVSAIGLNFAVNFAPTTLSIFDVNDALIDTLTISHIDLPRTNLGTGAPFSFIGLNADSNIISYAIIDTSLIGPLDAGGLFIDNLVYQRVAAVPEPSPLILLALGAFGFVFLKKTIK